MPLDAEDKAALDAVLAANPDLAKNLDRKTAYKPIGTEVVPAFELADDGPENLVVLLEPDPAPGSYSLLQRREDGEITGGFTLEAR